MDMERLVAINKDKPVIEVNHSDLELFDKDGSVYKTVCPACKEGVLLVRRDQQIHKLLPDDMCVLCGQKVRYKDIAVMMHKEYGTDGTLAIWSKK